MFDTREKFALFIDGANLFAASKGLGFDIDYRKLLEAFRKRGYVVACLLLHGDDRRSGILLDPALD